MSPVSSTRASTQGPRGFSTLQWGDAERTGSWGGCWCLEGLGLMWGLWVRSCRVRNSPRDGAWFCHGANQAQAACNLSSHPSTAWGTLGAGRGRSAPHLAQPGWIKQVIGMVTVR